MRQYKHQLADLLDVLNDLVSDFSDCASLVSEEEGWVESDLEEVSALCCGLLILGGCRVLPEIRQLDGGCFSRYCDYVSQMKNLVKLVRGGNKKALTTLRHLIATFQKGVREVALKMVKQFP